MESSGYLTRLPISRIDPESSRVFPNRKRGLVPLTVYVHPCVISDPPCQPVVSASHNSVSAATSKRRLCRYEPGRIELSGASASDKEIHPFDLPGEHRDGTVGPSWPWPHIGFHRNRQYLNINLVRVTEEKGEKRSPGPVSAEIQVSFFINVYFNIFPDMPRLEAFRG
jgi:hypothetical protein